MTSAWTHQTPLACALLLPVCAMCPAPLTCCRYGVMAARLGAVGLSAEVVKQRVQELEQLRPK
jgi:hypothetical protein